MKFKLFALLIFMFYGSAAYAPPSGTRVTTYVTQSLLFGTITPDSNGGVIERYSGIRNVSGTASFSGTSQDGQIRVTLTFCSAINEYMCGFDLSFMTTTLTGPGNNMTINLFRPSATMSDSFDANPLYATFGARIAYGANQTPGTYTGEIPVAVTGTPSGIPYLESVPVSITIAQPPITITNGRALNFGRVIPDISGGTIMISTASDTPSNVAGNSTFDGGALRGIVNITGAANTLVYISPISNTTLSGPGGNLTLSSITTNVTSRTLSSTGTSNFYTGGRLAFPAGITPGVYSGTYNVTVNY
ncbi:MAG: DUF4402 domain-containing protein [Alphaproteobacteria bacterium]|nr:DUF4402 domain-containing protein [Alphaproteobacteria bacterium]